MYYCSEKLKDPKKEKLKNFRHTDKYFSYDKECSHVKKEDRRHYRSKCKQLMREGKYDKLTKHVKTSGWLTW
ncbi:hypothetical protein BFG57_08935 [Bacillus solimangrovi]|uniref:Uncharacterized protein n=1 Tax=Bacillus solimangrovi TaxID=1305675 RepID=A0A1E5LJI0_9BACI|nr:hypothetical protein BFG57_08935 [Bacillus solimangrovi]